MADLLWYAKYRLEYYQTLINPQVRLYKDTTWISQKKKQSIDNINIKTASERYIHG
jgi:hypothetical protein